MTTDTSTIDRVDIADLFTRPARLLDECRWADADTICTDDVAVHSPRGGELHGIDNVVDFLRKAEIEGERAEHLTTDLLVDVDGEQAAASANSLVCFYREANHPTGQAACDCPPPRSGRRQAGGSASSGSYPRGYGRNEFLPGQ